MSNKKGLGKGLAALMGEAKLQYASTTSIKNDGFGYIQLREILPNKQQPRKHISQEGLDELASSIKENGVLQPILLQKLPDDTYRIIAGERRWRAAKIAGLESIPAIIKQYTSVQEFEVALIENIQRQDLNAIDEAQGYLRLVKEFGYTQEDLAKVIGKSRSHIANILRLNSLPLDLQEQIANGQISMGHAKVLVGLEDAQNIAQVIIKRGLSVRETENYVKNLHKNSPAITLRAKKVKQPNNDPEIANLERQLSEKLATKVYIEFAEFGGTITITFENLDDLDNILSNLG